MLSLSCYGRGTTKKSLSPWWDSNLWGRNSSSPRRAQAIYQKNKRQWNPNITRCQGILFHTFYFNWGLAPICKEPENSIQWQPLETSYPQQKWDVQPSLRDLSKGNKLPKMCHKMSALYSSCYEQPASWYCLFAGLSKVASCRRKSPPTWLVSAGYSAWHFFTNGIFLNTISLDWPLTLKTQPSTSNLSDSRAICNEHFKNMFT